MQLDEVELRNKLRQIVIDQPGHGPNGVDDLVQELHILFLKIEAERPGQRRGWYFKACRFRLGDVMLHGRSVDSGKRAARQCPWPEFAAEDSAAWLADQSDSGHVFEHASASQMFSDITARLIPKDREILQLLCEDWNITEIADRFGVSRAAVRKYRKKIVKTALRLGITPIWLIAMFDNIVDLLFLFTA